MKIVAVAVVAHALWGMATKLTPDRPRITLALVAAAAALIVPSALAQVLIIFGGGLVGWLLFPKADTVTRPAQPFRLRRRVGTVLLVAFFALPIGLPFLREATGRFDLAVIDSFYRAGSLVFGGGHVVLPLLQAEVVPPGWVDNVTYTAGYGAAQALPGPLFTFSAFLGTAMQPGWAGLWTGLLALVAIFVPSFLLLLGVLPFWDRLRALSPIQAALTPLWSASSWRRSTTQCGRAPFSARPTLRLR